MSKENHWIDNGTSCVCPVCRCEVDNPSEYFAFKCPRCGFQDEKDQDKIDEMGKDFYSLIPDDDVNERDCISAAAGMLAKGYRKQIVAEWIYHEWVSSYDGAKSGYSCSCCDAFVDENVFDTDEFHKRFCGNCGAKMKL